MAGSSVRSAAFRAGKLAALSLAGYVLLAGPMIWSEIGNLAYAARMRLYIGLICGAIGAPMIIAAAWRKRAGFAFASIFVPPAGAAVLAAMAWSDDYSFFHIAAPLSYVTVILTFLVLPDRDRTDGGRLCPTCGYDLRASRGGRCPECGGDPAAPSRRAARPRAVLIGLAWLLAAAIVSGTLHTLFLRWQLSLG